MVRSIANAIGRQLQGEVIARDIEQRANRVATQARGLRPVRFAYLIWRDPWMSLNGDTFVDAMLTLAGGVNVFANAAERYPVVRLDQLRDAAPDVVLLSSEPFPFAEIHALELAAQTGFDAERFQLVDGELLSWHGSRTPRGIDYAEEVITRARGG